jgi:hypothetical protein
MTEGADLDDKPSGSAQVLDALREIELLVAELYRRFARAFAEDRDLWEGLSREEEGHAALAEALKAMGSEAETPAALGKIHLAALETYKKGLEYQLGRLGRGEIARRNALFIARDLEKTLVERMYYDLVKGGGQDAGDIAARIQAETESHFGKLEAYIASLPGGPR